MPRYSFTLYVIGNTPRTRRAERQCRHLLGLLSGADHQLSVVDLLKQDGGHLQDPMLTPRLVRTAPQPRAEVVGDLSDTMSVAEALGLRLASPPPGMGGMPYSLADRSW